MTTSKSYTLAGGHRCESCGALSAVSFDLHPTHAVVTVPHKSSCDRRPGSELWNAALDRLRLLTRRQDLR